MEKVKMFTAFLAGVVSFFSPCVLPIIPGYISLITGIAVESLINNEKNKINIKKKVLLNSFFFVLGFTTIFVLLQIFLGKILSQTQSKILNIVFGTIIIILGLHFMGIIKIKFLYYQKNLGIKINKISFINSFLVGTTFGFAWTPCVGPILASILLWASREETLLKGTVLLLLYSAGFGIPFIITAILIEKFLNFIKKFTKSLGIIEIIAGILLVFVGILVLTDNFEYLHSIF